MRIGILALQGDVAEHETALRAVGADPVQVRRGTIPIDLDALIVPGGESTTIGQLAEEYGLVEAIRAFATTGRPVWGVCAGLIVLAQDAGLAQPQIGLLDVAVERNAFGRQIDSFETDVLVRGVDGGPVRGVFIRAPAIRRVGPTVEILAQLEDDTIVAVRQGNVLGTAFHPELTSDGRLYRFFMSLATDGSSAVGG